MNDTMPQVHNLGDLKNLLQQYGGMLSPENRLLIQSLIGELEKGGDPQALLRLAGQMQQSASRQQQQINNMPGGNAPGGNHNAGANSGRRGQNGGRSGNRRRPATASRNYHR